MNDFINVINSDDFIQSVIMFYGLFMFTWLIKLGINCILSIFDKI